MWDERLSQGKGWRGGLFALGLAVVAGAPSAASACAVSRPLSAETMAERAAAEARAWREAPLVYLARIAAMGSSYESFTLEPVRVLKGNDAPSRLVRPPEPSPGMCLFYHGLSVENGAWLGDEFVIYALETPADRDSRMLIVSRRMLADPATRAALQ